jgi:DNA-binding response OmpR family regulator
LPDEPRLPPGLEVYRPAELLGRAILVVDDEGSLRRQLTGDLRALGYRPLAADSAAAARQALDSEAVDAVILDLLLDGEDDGFQLLSWIRERSPRLPVSVLSAARTASAHIRRAYELGASSYFVKGNIPLAHLYSDLAARMLEAGR